MRSPLTYILACLLVHRNVTEPSDNNTGSASDEESEAEYIDEFEMVTRLRGMFSLRSSNVSSLNRYVNAVHPFLLLSEYRPQTRCSNSRHCYSEPDAVSGYRQHTILPTATDAAGCSRGRASFICCYVCIISYTCQSFSDLLTAMKCWRRCLTICEASLLPH